MQIQGQTLVDRKTLIRFVETFVIVFLSAFLAQVTVDGTPIDLSRAESQSRVLTAALSAAGIAWRRAAASPSLPPPAPPA